MVKNYSEEIRNIAIDHFKAGHTPKFIATHVFLDKFASEQTIRAWKKAYEEEGKTVPAKSQGRPRTATSTRNSNFVLKNKDILSGRALSRKLKISPQSVQAILKRNGFKVI